MTLCRPCVDSKRPRVYVQKVSVCTGTTHTCFNTCARGAGIHGDVFECTHGGVLEAKYGFFPRFFSVPQLTHTHTLKTHHDHNDTTQNNTQHHTETERDRERQRETERDREKQRKKTEKERKRDRERETRQHKKREDETRKEKKREDERGDEKRQEKMKEKRRGKRRGKMKKKREEKREEKRKGKMKREDFFSKNVSRPSNPPDELAKNVSKKNPFRTNCSSIFLRKFRILPCFQLFT